MNFELFPYELENIGGDTQTITVNGNEYIFEINDISVEGNYDDKKDCVMTFTFEGIYYPAAESVLATEEIGEEPIQESESEIDETEEPRSYSTMKNYVHNREAGNGITAMKCKVFTFQDDKTQATIEATIRTSGHEFILSFDGDATLGIKAESNADGSACFIYNQDETQLMEVYNSGGVTQEVFDQFKEHDLKEYFSSGNADEYYEETKDDTYISAITATTSTFPDGEYKGYLRVILDLEKGIGVHLAYLMPAENYDEQVAYDAISSAKIITEDESLTSLFIGN